MTSLFLCLVLHVIPVSSVTIQGHQPVHIGLKKDGSVTNRVMQDCAADSKAGCTKSDLHAATTKTSSANLNEKMRNVKGTLKWYQHSHILMEILTLQKQFNGLWIFIAFVFLLAVVLLGTSIFMARKTYKRFESGSDSENESGLVPPQSSGLQHVKVNKKEAVGTSASQKAALNQLDKLALKKEQEEEDVSDAD